MVALKKEPRACFCAKSSTEVWSLGSQQGRRVAFIRPRLYPFLESQSRMVAVKHDEARQENSGSFEGESAGSAKVLFL